jgi:hypothetical protein
VTKIPKSKPAYDLKERTFQFVKPVWLFLEIVPMIPLSKSNIDDGILAVKPPVE